MHANSLASRTYCDSCMTRNMPPRPQVRNDGGATAGTGTSPKTRLKVRVPVPEGARACGFSFGGVPAVAVRKKSAARIVYRAIRSPLSYSNISYARFPVLGVFRIRVLQHYGYI